MPADTPRPASPLDPLVRGLRVVLGPIASLKITVVLFVLAGLLVFFGTLAQKGQGVWTVVDNYFYSWWVKVELKYLLEFGKVFLNLSPDKTTDWWLPFPAGKSLGWVMVINLTAAHILQFVNLLDGARKQAARTRSTGADVGLLILKRSGIFILHGGVLLLLVGEYITREWAVEQQMIVPEGGASNYAYETRNFELSFVDQTDPTTDKVAVLPGKKMKEAVEARDRAAQFKLPAPSTRFSHDALPVDVEVVAYYPNSRVREIGPSLKQVVSSALPEKPRNQESNPAREAMILDAVAVLEAFDKAVAASPKEPPLPLFEKALAEASAGKFKGAGGPETLARIQAAVDEMKGQQQATTGLGLTYIATSAPEVTGVDNTQQIDLPSAYVNLFDKKTGNSLGIYLVSAGLTLSEEPPQEIPGQVARVELRPTRHYKDYTIRLNKFHFDKYVGTSTAKNYSSDVRLIDPELKQDRDVTIRMNDPLRHRGDAIFQSSFTQDEKATILQVVSNIGWWMPYLSCVLVMLGMAVHFTIKLVTFLVRTMSGVKTVAATDGPKPTGIDMTGRSLPPFARYGVPAIATAVALLLMVVCGMPRNPTKDRLDLQKLASLPVVEGGRVKPLDTVARVDLRLITHTEEFTDSGGKRRPALQWFMDVASTSLKQSDGPAAWNIFRIENEDVRSLMKLQRREGLRYSLNELREHLDTLQAEGDKAKAIPEKQRTLYQAKVLELGHHVESYLRLASGDAPLILPPDPAVEATEWRKLRIAQEQVMERARPKLVEEFRAAGIPLNPDEMNEDHQKRAVAIIVARKDEETKKDAALVAWERVLTTYADNDPKEFDAAVADYRKVVAEKVPASDLQRAELETFLNQSSLFYWCTVLYGVAGAGSLIGFVLLLLAPKASQTIRRGVFWWLVVTFVVHTFTLLARMYLMDRPLVFVTNLYSSAVFIGWGVVALCLILELVYPIGFGNLVASILGFSTTIIAHNLATSGDTLEMMVAVLDTNFWLATHVTTVTLGYSATYVAGLLGLLYVVLYVLPENMVLRQKVVIGSGIHQLNYDIGKLLGTLTYSVVCFATLLSFVGTVLGGIWADQSWGRFWGWDPKENGAVLIVLWNALILHARWGGMVKERGMSVLAVVGIIITTWSWFGTNQLGVGLHNYGFNNTLVRLCDGVWIGSLVAVLVGVLPWQWVYRGGQPAPPPRAERV